MRGNEGTDAETEEKRRREEGSETVEDALRWKRQTYSKTLLPHRKDFDYIKISTSLKLSKAKSKGVANKINMDAHHTQCG